MHMAKSTVYNSTSYSSQHPCCHAYNQFPFIITFTLIIIFKSLKLLTTNYNKTKICVTVYFIISHSRWVATKQNKDKTEIITE